MKKLFYLLVIIGLAIISCNKPDVLPTEIEVSFQASMGGTNLKAGDDIPTDCDTDEATQATLVISNGVENLSFTVDLIHDDNGAVYTQSIKLPVLAGDETYELISFELKDINGVSIFATPYADAPFGDFVTTGLPLDFDVNGFYKLNIPIQVLCYTPTTINEFGYSWFSFEKITVRELCFFGDICVDVDDYSGSLYEGQANGLQHDMPAIFELKASIWDADIDDWKIISVKDNEDWLGEGAALCVQYPDYEGIEDEYKIELSVLYFDGTDFVYIPFKSWEFTENDGFPVTDQDGDGVIDFVIGDCVPNADIIIDPDPDPDPTPEIEGETAFAYDDTDGLAICFLDDLSVDFERWGWTNGTYNTGTYILELWAGAADCDHNKGYYVGTVDLTIDNSGNVNVVYNITSGVLKEVHVYVGDAKYPLDNADEPSVAPGDFTFIDDEGSIDTDITLTLGEYDGDGVFDGSIYLIAHATVELPVVEDDK